ncbi:hypothetical protein B0J18DRAFT_416651 [Chaetomium sp. MPI-SDFR-AT-0129]|nr:hypothetical protein B0J18DRAFT_416651 [Chaetomium sp. MPI-SDFR-AT-0129]
MSFDDFDDLDLRPRVFDTDRDDLHTPRIVKFFPLPTPDPDDGNSNPRIAKIMHQLRVLSDRISLNNNAKTSTTSSSFGTGTSGDHPIPLWMEETAWPGEYMRVSEEDNDSEVGFSVGHFQETNPPISDLADNRYPDTQEVLADATLTTERENTDRRSLDLKRPLKAVGRNNNSPQDATKAAVNRSTAVPGLNPECLSYSEYFFDSEDFSGTGCFSETSEIGDGNDQDSEDPEDGDSGPGDSHNKGGQSMSGGEGVSGSSGPTSSRQSARSSPPRQSREGDNDDDPGDGGRRKRRNSSPGHRQAGRKTKPNLRRFACPYQVFDPPRQCLAKGSRNPEGGCDGIRRLMQHLARKHMISHRCRRCWISMDSKDKVAEHVLKNECSPKQQPENERFMNSSQERQVRDGRSFPRDEDAWWWVSKILIAKIEGSSDEYLKSNYSPFYGDLDRSGQTSTMPIVDWGPSNLAPENAGPMELFDTVDSIYPSLTAMTPLTQDATQSIGNMGLHNYSSLADVATQAPKVQLPTPSFTVSNSVTPFPQTPHTSVVSPATPAVAGHQTATQQTLFAATSPTFIETPGLFSPSLAFSSVAPLNGQQQWAQPQMAQPQMLTPAENTPTAPAATKSGQTETSNREVRLQNIINRLTRDIKDLEARDTENKMMKETSGKAVGHIQDLINEVLAEKGLEEGLYQKLEEVAEELVTVRKALR